VAAFVLNAERQQQALTAAPLQKRSKVITYHARRPALAAVEVMKFQKQDLERTGSEKLGAAVGLPRKARTRCTHIRPEEFLLFVPDATHARRRNADGAEIRRCAGRAGAVASCSTTP
jgi:hypothetical protein